jgi:hypothetical protein
MPWIVVVALGEPGMPVICWACAVTAVSDKPRQYGSNLWQPMIPLPCLHYRGLHRDPLARKNFTGLLF